MEHDKRHEKRSNQGIGLYVPFSQKRRKKTKTEVPSLLRLILAWHVSGKPMGVLQFAQSVVHFCKTIPLNLRNVLAGTASKIQLRHLNFSYFFLLTLTVQDDSLSELNFRLPYPLIGAFTLRVQ